MKTTLTLPAEYRRNNVSLAELAGQVFNLIRCAVSAVFSPSATMAVAGILIAAMWWQNLTIADSVAAGRAAATTAICFSPWACVASFRSLFAKKGGEQ